MTELDLEAILAGADEDLPPGHRSGLVALVGRPNVGKSTLLNALVGEKVSIVSDVPGTTRNAIRGVVTRDDAQVVFVDTPGLAKPQSLLARRLNDVVRDHLDGVDVVVFLVDVEAGIGRGDEFLARVVRQVRAPVLAVANKEDQVRRDPALPPQLVRLAELVPDAEIVPTSALDGFNVDVLLELIVAALPEGPRIFPTDLVTDQPERLFVAEVVREKYLGRLRDELPHSVAVVVEDIREIPVDDDPDDPDDPGEIALVEIDASIYVERDSQKGIVIGHRGATLRDAGTEARRELQALFGAKVHLDVRVKVAKEWQRDPKQLRRLGY
ncbi:GTPase Era [Salsipaludibacter albus]|uniref:GTPase Era n=1 Tax=Salsipaludibacter albus TaxID=2849650 RepID=UPI001EE48924|nr:GTPase Era [Salsipaludibacter albus]MBY5162190.1 GTPase Era [Salsipaludibacter albus]